MNDFEPKQGHKQNALKRIVERSLEMTRKSWYVKREMEETVQVEGKCKRGEKGFASPKTSKHVLLKVRLEYELGTWSSIPELAKRHGLNDKSLYARILREGWKVKRDEIVRQAEKEITQAVVREVSKQELYLTRLAGRAAKYEQIIDASLEQAGAKDAQGVNVLDLEAIDVVTRSEARLVEMNRVAYRIPTMSSQDITTAGQDLGASFVMAIAKLREANAPKLSSEDLSKVLEAEIEP